MLYNPPPPRAAKEWAVKKRSGSQQPRERESSGRGLKMGEGPRGVLRMVTIKNRKEITLFLHQVVLSNTWSLPIIYTHATRAPLCRLVHAKVHTEGKRGVERSVGGGGEREGTGGERRKIGYKANVIRGTIDSLGSEKTTRKLTLAHIINVERK